MDGTDSGSCQVADFGVNSVRTSGSATTMLIKFIIHPLQNPHTHCMFFSFFMLPFMVWILSPRNDFISRLKVTRAT